MIKQIGVVIKPKPEPVKISQALAQLIEWFNSRSLNYILTTEAAGFIDGNHTVLPVNELIERVDLIVALGGDGTLLSLARLTASLKLPILAVNLGGLGFITEVKVEEMIPALELINAADYRTEKRMMLEVSHFEEGRVVNRCRGLNDVVINKTALSRLIDLQVLIDDKNMTTYAADGLIVATPTGSTAYSLSAGGPIVHPDMEALIITPICPHTLTNRPVIVNSKRILKVINLSSNNKVNLTVDGQEFYEVAPRGEVVIKRSEDYLTLIVSPDKDYFQVLSEKLRWSGRP